MKSSAPATTTRMRPSEKVRPASKRVTPKASSAEPAVVVVAKTAPSAMKAPARIARTNSFDVASDAFAVPISSALAAMAGGGSASKPAAGKAGAPPSAVVMRPCSPSPPRRLLQPASWICHHHAMWMALLVSWLSNTVALFVAAWIIPDMGYGDDFWVLFIAALVFTLVNWLVRPIVILLALPAVILTFGLALILINTFMLYLTDWIVPSFETGASGGRSSRRSSSRSSTCSSACC